MKIVSFHFTCFQTPHMHCFDAPADNFSLNTAILMSHGPIREGCTYSGGFKAFSVAQISLAGLPEEVQA